MKVDVVGASGTQVVLIPNGPAGPAFSTAVGAFYSVADQTNAASSNARSHSRLAAA